MVMFLVISILCRRLVIQVYAYGARLLDGGFMVQELNFKAPNSEIGPASESQKVTSVSIADPYVLLRMVDGSIQLIVGGISKQFRLYSS